MMHRSADVHRLGALRDPLAPGLHLTLVTELRDDGGSPANA